MEAPAPTATTEGQVLASQPTGVAQQQQPVGTVTQAVQPQQAVTTSVGYPMQQQVQVGANYQQQPYGMQGQFGYPGQQGQYMGQPGMPGQPGQPGMPPMVPQFGLGTLLRLIMEVMCAGQGFAVMYGMGQEMTSAHLPLFQIKTWVMRTIGGVMRSLWPFGRAPANDGAQVLPGLPPERWRLWVILGNLYFVYAFYQEYKTWLAITRNTLPTTRAMAAVPSAQAGSQQQAQMPARVPRAFEGAVPVSQAAAQTAPLRTSSALATRPEGVPPLTGRGVSAPALARSTTSASGGTAKPWLQTGGQTQATPIPAFADAGNTGTVATDPAPATSTGPTSFVSNVPAAMPSSLGPQEGTAAASAPNDMQRVLDFYMQKQKEMHRERQAKREGGASPDAGVSPDAT